LIKAIKTTKEHKLALNRIADLMKKKLSEKSSEYAELEVLSILVDEYESNAFPIDPPDPVEAITFRLEQIGLNTSAPAENPGSKVG
jgi:HTH-type transcriptional regulator / antitoxin HigA